MGRVAAKLISVTPRVSEKTVAMSKDKSYVFDVPLSATKREIIVAIQNQYDVTVNQLQTMIIKGKRKPSMRRRNRPVSGRRSAIKKAVFTLSKGTITVLEENK